MPHTVPSREHTRHQSQSRSRSQLHIQALSLFAARDLPVLPYTTPGLAFTARYTVVHSPGRRLPSPSQRRTPLLQPGLSLPGRPPSTVTSTSNKVSQEPIDRVVSPSSALVPGAGANGPQSYYCHCIIIPTTLTVTTPGESPASQHLRLTDSRCRLCTTATVMLPMVREKVHAHTV